MRISISKCVKTNKISLKLLSRERIRAVLKYSKEHSEVTPVLLNEKQLEILPLSWTTTFEDVKLNEFLNSSITYLKSTGRIANYQKKYDTELFYDLPKLEKIK